MGMAVSETTVALTGTDRAERFSTGLAMLIGVAGSVPRTQSMTRTGDAINGFSRQLVTSGFRTRCPTMIPWRKCSSRRQATGMA